MNNRTLPLSLLIGAALAIPTLAMAAPAGTTAAIQTKATAKNSTVAVVAAVESTDDNASANTSNNDAKTDKFSPFAISETQTISRARVTSNLGQQPMTTEIKAPLEALKNSELQTTKIISEEAVLDAEEDLTEVSEEDDL